MDAVVREAAIDKKKSLILKIAVPVAIVLVIGVMWFVKNAGEQKTETPNIVNGADFSLSITEAVDFEALSEYGIPAIIDYGADSCIPCKQMAPVLETLNKEMSGKAFIKFADVWQYPEAASNVPVQVIPTQVLINADGTPFVSSEDLASEIQFDMYSHKETGEHVFTVHQGGLTEEQMRKILKEMGVE